MAARKKGTRYSLEFKESAVKLANEDGNSAYKVAKELGVNINTLYSWIKKYSALPISAKRKSSSQAEFEEEIKRLRKELKRVTEEREILKKATAYFAREDT